MSWSRKIGRHIKSEYGRLKKKKWESAVKDLFYPPYPKDSYGKTIDVVRHHPISGRVVDVKMYEINSKGRLDDVTPPWDEPVPEPWDAQRDAWKVEDGSRRGRPSRASRQSRPKLSVIRGGSR